MSSRTAHLAEPSRTRATFSLEPSGPLQEVCRRSGMFRILSAVKHRTVILAAIAWVPLAVLTVMNDMALGGAQVPFFYDLDAHIRLLIALPILIAGESLVGDRIRNTVAQFTIRGLIPPEEQRRFDQACHGVQRLNASIIPEILMLALTFGLGHWLWHDYIALRVATWYGTEIAGSVHLTTPGNWLAYVSLPLFRFMLLRWYFRLGIWYWFLARLSRIKLRLNALHPDRAGGLGFLAASAFAFIPLLLAQTILMSSIIADRIWHEGMTLPQFKLEIVVVLAFMVLVVVLPLTFFTVQLSRVRRAELRAYGAMASDYVHEFWQKWQTEKGKTKEAFIGSADIQSLADLGNSFSVAQEMSVLPISRGAIIRLAVTIGVPFLPLVLTMVPLESAIDRAIQMVF